MNLFESNAAALENFQPMLVAELRKTEPSHHVNLVPVPQNVPAVDVIVVAGLPTADSWAPLLESRSPYIVVEPSSLGELRTYLSLMNLVKPLGGGVISFAVGDDGVLQLLNDLFGTLYRRKVTLFGEPGTPAHNAALKSMRFFDTLCAANRATLDQFAEDWQRNLSDNIRDFIAGPFLQDQFGRWKGGKAVIVAAGPSLDEAQDASAFGGAAVVACDTAAPVLAARGIAPDLIVTLDSSEQNQTYLNQLPQSIYESSILCVTPLVNRQVYAPFRRVLFYSYGHPTLDFFRDCGLGFEPLASGGSVALTALDIARTLGVSQAYLLGFDFQSYRFRTHARGTGAALRAMAATNRLMPVEQYLFNYQSDIESGPAAESPKDTVTDKKFQKWKEWLELYVKTNDDIKIFQMSAFSARIAGISMGRPAGESLAQISADRRDLNPNVRRDLKFLLKEIEMALSAQPADILRRVTTLPRVSKSFSYILAWLSDKPAALASERLRNILDRFHAGVTAALE